MPLQKYFTIKADQLLHFLLFKLTGYLCKLLQLYLFIQISTMSGRTFLNTSNLFWMMFLHLQLLNVVMLEITIIAAIIFQKYVVILQLCTHTNVVDCIYNATLSCMPMITKYNGMMGKCNIIINTNNIFSI